MISRFDGYNKIEDPNMYLCNPDQKPIAAINAENRHLVLRFNDLSELTFTVPKIKCAENEYNLIETKRLVQVEDIGWFQITSVNETVEGDYYTKEVTAESHQTTFKNRGFSTEERVYMFYNPKDPKDEDYKSSDLKAIPSVIGQLYKQLGIKVAVSNSDLEPGKDFKEWTITYVDPELKFDPDSTNNICRNFTQKTTYGYDFMVNDVENAFGIIFDFDFLHHVIKAKFVENITKSTDIYLSFENVLKSMNVKENAEDIVTVLSCNGSDLDIRTVNPMGTNYIVNFDYYKKEKSDDGKIEYPWMSKELIEALNAWKIEWERWQKDDENRVINKDGKSEYHIKGFSSLVEELQKKYLEQDKLLPDIKTANLKLTDILKARDQLYDSSEKDNEDDISEGIICAEIVKINEYSLLPGSTYCKTTADGMVNENAKDFTEDATITAYTSAPKIIKKTITTAEGKEISRNVFSFEDASGNEIQGKEGTAKSFIEDFIDTTPSDNAEESDNTNCWYFMDCPEKEDDDDSKKTNKRRTYCKLTVDSEVSIVKNELGDIDKNGSVEVRGVSFNVSTGTENTFTITLPDERLVEASESDPYFNYNGTRYRVLKSADDVISVYAFYISGFERYTTYQMTPTWCDLWESHLKDLKASKDKIQKESIDPILSETKYISEQCDIQKYIKRKSDTLYNEFSNYWIEGDYENNNFATFDTTTMSERVSLAKQLMKAGQDELAKVSQPTFEMSVDAVNFIKILEFKPFTEQLQLGRRVTVEKNEETHYYPALITIEYDLDGTESFSLTFSNASKPNDTAMTYADLIKEASSTSRTVAANWSNLMDYAKNKDEITDLIKAPLDRTLRDTFDNLANQEFTVDSTGILGRKWTNDLKTSFQPEQVRIVNNTIIFTQDNWETASLALGKISYGEDKTAYGLVADVLVGKLILGEEMVIGTNDDKVLINGEGITIKTKKKVINEETNEEIETELDVFKADTEGNVKVIGDVTAETGRFGSVIIKDGGIQTENKSFIIDKDGNVTIRGIIHAKEGGDIAGWNISDTCLYKEEQYEDYRTAIKLQTAYGSGTGEGNIDTINPVIEVLYGNDTDESLESTFFVRRNGFLYAKNAKISGEIHATRGEIAGLTIGSLINDSGETTYYLGTDLDETPLEITKYGIKVATFCDSLNGTMLTIRNSKISQGSGRQNHNYIDLSYKEASNKPIEMKVVYDTTTKKKIHVYTDDGALIAERTFEVQYRLGGIGGWDWYTYKGGITVGAGAVGSEWVDIGASRDIVAVRFAESLSDSLVINNASETSTSNYIGVNGTVIPVDNECDLGTETKRWRYGYFDTIYYKNEEGNVGVSSDKRLKNTIEDLDMKYDLLFDRLRPVTFKYNNGTSGRLHIGLIANEVEDALAELNIPTNEFAVYCQATDGDKTRSIRYNELVSLNIYEIQQIKKKLNELEKQIITKCNKI